MNTPYLPRLIRHRVFKALADTPVVCLLGPRQVGKSTLAQRLEPERAYISLDDVNLLQTAQQKDAAGLAKLAEQVGKGFRGGMLIYTGRHCLKLPVPSCFAVPIGMLWGEQPGQPISSADVWNRLAAEQGNIDTP